MGELQKVRISSGEVFLDEFQLKNVKGFALVSSADGTAELTLKMDVIIDSVGSELKQ